MKKAILNNGVRLIYVKRDVNISSFCIGFDAGALREENEFKYGTAHALEHMLYKGTLKRSEREINNICDEVFGFNNAMTNYPYVIYYGTTLTKDFERGIELYSDIILNPAFNEVGFDEEMNVICEELKEWKNDLTQYCEDMLFFNSFNKRRIKERIIGSGADVRSISIKDIKKFYDKFYIPSNCVISIVSSLEYEQVYNLINKYLGDFGNYKNIYLQNNYEDSLEGIFVDEVRKMEGSKIQYCFPIHELNSREVKVLNLFNFHFGESISSILYDEIRTKRGLAYEVTSKVKNENGIKLLTIYASTSKENTNRVIDIINRTIISIKNKHEYDLDLDKINKISNMLKIRKELLLEKSIQLCKELTTYELMYNSCDEVYSEVESLDIVEPLEMHDVILKTFKKLSIQILK